MTAVAVPPLVGTMPPACRQDLEAMREFAGSRAVQGGLGPPVAPAEFKQVFLTGSTGFVGRFLLRDLLVQDETRVVHCLVRAADVAQGFERVRAALQRACIWNEAYSRRIHVVVGDLKQERFGLDETDFARLCQVIDAVYHMAAEVALAAPYVNVRGTNVMSLKQVLDLCLSVRIKQLFFASTLGMFPEYFCGFTKEFQDSRIETQMQPDVDIMKSLFPVGMFGYPWSKLVAEQVLLTAQAMGLPVAVFRLCRTGVSTAGFPDADEITTRVYSAMIDVGARPQGAVFEWLAEPADVLSRALTEISLNPHRRYTVYHCCNPCLMYSDLALSDFGIYLREVSYATFKRLCLARGARSPLHRFWPLVDYFAAYWFSLREPRDTQAICDRAMREDCPTSIKWPGALTLLQRTEDWVRDHPAEWPYPRAQSCLDFERLVSETVRHAEGLGHSRDDVLPEWMAGGLFQLVKALKAPEARLRESAKGRLVLELSRSLWRSIRLAEDRSRYPNIAATDIVQPVFLVGINRTGTTLFHRLLSRDPRFRALRGYELLGSFSVDLAQAGTWGTPDDFRYQQFFDWLETTGLAKQFEGLHHVDPNEAEEDIVLLQSCFHNWVATARFHVPAYGHWLEQADLRHAYRYHRRTLQHFSYVDQLRELRHSQWLLKMPFHMMALDALIRIYPDALFIQTHRVPVQFMGSWNSLVERVRSLYADPLPRSEQGIEQLNLMSRMMDKCIEFRLSRPDLEHRWIDLSYYDLVRDPLTAVESVYGYFGWDLEPRTKAAMDDWLRLQSRRRSTETPHRYDLADYGLSPDKVDMAFARYREFVIDRDIHRSPL